MSHVKWEIFLHLVWRTWNREPILAERFLDRIFSLIRMKADELGCELLAVGAVEDHIHILVSVSPKTTIPELVKHLKGTTSHLINHELNPETPFKWQGGYGAFSVSKANLAKTKAYVENQKQHHADGTVVAYYENWDC